MKVYGPSAALGAGPGEHLLAWRSAETLAPAGVVADAYDLECHEV